MKMNLHSVRFILGLLLAAMVSLTVTGCKKNVSYQVPDSALAKPAKPGKPPSNGSYCYVVEGEPVDPIHSIPVLEVSAISTQTVVVKMTGLQAGKPYKVTWLGYDGAKQLVEPAEEYEFVPDNDLYFAWHRFEPEYPKQKPGRWKWVAEVSDLGKFTAELKVLLPTPDQVAEIERTAKERAADLKRYEKARENMLNAYCHYWLGLDGTFHTIITPGKPGVMTDEDREIDRIQNQYNILREALSQYQIEERRRQANIRPNDEQSYALPQILPYELEGMERERRQLGGELFKREEERARRKGSGLGYLQVAGVEWSVSKDFVSEADTLNGITYRARMSCTFRVFRYFRPDGWTEWQDCHQNSNALAVWASDMFGSMPKDLAQRLKLNFETLERDGNWFVWTPEGDVFANGKQKEDKAEWKNERPLPEYARQLVSGRKSLTRESYREMGEEARKNPTVLDSSVITSMDMLRGKQLIR